MGGFCPFNVSGEGTYQCLECQTYDQKVLGAGVAGFFPLQGQLSVLTLILVAVPPPHVTAAEH